MLDFNHTHFLHLSTSQWEPAFGSSHSAAHIVGGRVCCSLSARVSPAQQTRLISAALTPPCSRSFSTKLENTSAGCRSGKPATPWSPLPLDLPHAASVVCPTPAPASAARATVCAAPMEVPTVAWELAWEVVDSSAALQPTVLAQQWAWAWVAVS